MFIDGMWIGKVPDHKTVVAIEREYYEMHQKHLRDTEPKSLLRKFVNWLRRKS